MPNDQLIRIQEKLQILLGSYEAVQRENDRLRKQAAEQSLRVAEESEKIESLEKTISVLRTLSVKLDPNDKRELEKRLNQYLKDIDKCISMLSE